MRTRVKSLIQMRRQTESKSLNWSEMQPELLFCLFGFIVFYLSSLILSSLRSVFHYLYFCSSALISSILLCRPAVCFCCRSPDWWSRQRTKHIFASMLLLKLILVKMNIETLSLDPLGVGLNDCQHFEKSRFPPRSPTHLRFFRPELY